MVGITVLFDRQGSDESNLAVPTRVYAGAKAQEIMC